MTIKSESKAEDKKQSKVDKVSGPNFSKFTGKSGKKDAKTDDSLLGKRKAPRPVDG